MAPKRITGARKNKAGESRARQPTRTGRGIARTNPAPDMAAGRSDEARELNDPPQVTLTDRETVTIPGREGTDDNRGTVLAIGRGSEAAGTSEARRVIPDMNNAVKESSSVLETNSVMSMNATPSHSGSEDRNLSTSEALKLIPEYDGKNMSIEDYSYECRTVYNMSKEADRRIIIRLILSKIKGSAKEIVKRKEYNSLEELINDLMKVFGADDDYTNLSNELGRLTQGEAESVVEWGVKVKRYVDDMIAISRKECGANSSMDRLMTQQGILRFIRGIKPEVNQHLVGMRFNTLDEVISKARQIERELTVNRDIYKMKESSPMLREIFKIDSTGQDNTIKRPIVCYSCKGEGHIARNCENQPQGRNNTQMQQRNRNYNPPHGAENTPRQPQHSSWQYNQNNEIKTESVNQQPQTQNQGWQANDNSQLQIINQSPTPNPQRQQNTQNNQSQYNQYNPNQGQSNQGYQQQAVKQERNNTNNQGERPQIKQENFKNPNQDRVTVCFNCLKPGHVKRNCTSKSVCNFCGREGHEMKNCRIFNLKCKLCSTRGHTERYCSQEQRKRDFIQKKENQKNA